jgi:hypothetical protein
MKKTKKSGNLRPEYKRSDFGTLVRGKYAKRLQQSLNVVVLDPETADLFPNAASVNAALHALAEIARRSAARPREIFVIVLKLGRARSRSANARRHPIHS